jgi:DNA (cytosine-5)-methyltransferase 1
MKYFSTFSGIGGFELGITQAYEKLCTTNKKQGLQGAGSEEGQRSECTDLSTNGLTCVGYSEIDKYAAAIYQSHFPEHKNYGDITKINADELPDFDILVGGFPCQAFSIAGRRMGFDDTRGTLFFDLARILKAKQPRLFVFENVKGLLSHDNGKTFSTIISTLDELGYDLQWQVLNSKDFGVPQNRERVFIIGHLRGTRRPEVFPIRTTDNSTFREFASTTIDANYWKGIDNHGARTAIIQLNEPKHSNDRVYSTGGVSPTLNTMQGGRRQPFIQTIPHGFNVGWKKELPNLRSHSGAIHNEILMPAIRRLTPTECERLQGFPDGWTDSVSDTQRYKTLGNAVTVNVVRAICGQLLLQLQS